MAEALQAPVPNGGQWPWANAGTQNIHTDWHGSMSSAGGAGSCAGLHAHGDAMYCLLSIALLITASSIESAKSPAVAHIVTRLS